MLGIARRWLAAAWLVAAAVALVVLLVARPGDDGAGGGSQVANERPRAMSICNLFFSGVPDRVRVSLFPTIATGEERHVVLLFWDPADLALVDDLIRGEDVPVPSRVIVDGMTGELVSQHFRSDKERADLERVLANMVVGPPDPDAWPRTDKEPATPRVRLVENIAYRPPDPRSGVLVSIPFAEQPYLVVSTCDSALEVNAETEEVLHEDVVAEEEAMLERFLSEVLRPQQAALP